MSSKDKNPKYVLDRDGVIGFEEKKIDTDKQKYD